jgi:uncharacterized protein YegL
MSCGESATFSGINGDGVPLIPKSEPVPEEEQTQPSADANPDQVPAGTKTPITSEEGTPPVIDIAVATNLYWLWPCNGQTLEVPTTGVTIEGTGEFQLDVQDDLEINLMITGGYCEPTTADRDVVFAVDISSSMRTNDRRRNNSCGRLQAIDAVLDTLEPTDQVGLVTFDSRVRTSIPLQSVADFRANPDYSYRTLCVGRGNTNFRNALEGTQNILSKARAQSFQEIYFLSDGENSTGAEEAASLRQQATIATFGLKGSDKQLSEVIASKDKNGAPLHRKVADAGDLAAAFKDMSISKLVSGSLAVGHFGGDPEDSYEVDPTVGELFTIPKITITKAEYPEGMAFDLEYVDDRGRAYGGSASITWK